MKYLSYQIHDGAVTAVPSETIDKFSRFQPDGNLYALRGIDLGYNVAIFGVLAPGGGINFNKYPIDHPSFSLGFTDFGQLVPQADGTVAINWPL
jgi:hypothetical protein